MPTGLAGTFLERSVLEVSADELREALGGPADVVLSDMAPFTTGDRCGDHFRQVALAQVGLDRAIQVLRVGGHFCVKLFDGQDIPAFTKGMRKHFDKTRRIKPEAVRGTSVEFYLVGLGFKA
jgi:23S rRNA (uridine2552-2'-O)-methyltransferase